jgi:hypothetical protein
MLFYAKGMVFFNIQAWNMAVYEKMITFVVAS